MLSKYYFLCLSLSCFIAFGAEAARTKPLEHVIVTASRTPTTVEQAGASVTVINRETIENRQVQYALDLLRDVPGFALSRSGPAGKFTQLRVRGGEANHVLVLIDGVEANDVANSDEFDFANLLAADIERIEIIRGPQSALWGSDAVSGVVHIITRRAQRPAEAGVSLEGGSFGSRRVSAHLGSRGRALPWADIARLFGFQWQ